MNNEYELMLPLYTFYLIGCTRYRPVFGPTSKALNAKRLPGNKVGSLLIASTANGRPPNRTNEKHAHGIPGKDGDARRRKTVLSGKLELNLRCVDLVLECKTIQTVCPYFSVLNITIFLIHVQKRRYSTTFVAVVVMQNEKQNFVLKLEKS
uniref:Uncharacterized protein n=1 Tax=Glossina palpalis gambiensis TaxID=67801 RepID=A0A1B0BWW7_9MUSC